MGCFVFILALLVPRLAMVFIFLLTNWFAVAYDSFLWPLLGFIFLPYTTLAYMGAMVNTGSVQGIWLVLVIIAVLVDLGHLGGSGRVGRRRRRRRR